MFVSSEARGVGVDDSCGSYHEGGQCQNAKGKTYGVNEKEPGQRFQATRVVDPSFIEVVVGGVAGEVNSLLAGGGRLWLNVHEGAGKIDDRPSVPSLAVWKVECANGDVGGVATSEEHADEESGVVVALSVSKGEGFVGVLPPVMSPKLCAVDVADVGCNAVHHFGPVFTLSRPDHRRIEGGYIEVPVGGAGSAGREGVDLAH